MMVASRPLLTLIRLTLLRAHLLLKSHISFYSNRLAILHSFLDITHIKVNDGLKSVILNLFELDFFRAYPYLKPHSLFYSNSPAIWHRLPDIRHIKINNAQ